MHLHHVITLTMKECHDYNRILTVHAPIPHGLLPYVEKKTKNEWGWLKLLAIHTTLSPEWNTQCYWLPGRYTYTGVPASAGIFACSCNFRKAGQKQAITGHSVTQRAADFPLCGGKGVQMRGGAPSGPAGGLQRKWLGTISRCLPRCQLLAAAAAVDGKEELTTESPPPLQPTPALSHTCSPPWTRTDATKCDARSREITQSEIGNLMSHNKNNKATAMRPIPK